MIAVDWGALSALAAIVSLAVVVGGGVATWWDRRKGGRESMRRQVRRIARYLFGEAKDDESNAPAIDGFGQRVDEFIEEAKDFQVRTERFMVDVRQELSMNGKPENTVKGAVVKLLGDVAQIQEDVTELKQAAK